MTIQVLTGINVVHGLGQDMQYIYCAAAGATVYWTVIFPHRISALSSYPTPSASRPHFATSTEMLNLLRAPSLLQTTAVAGLVAVLGIVVRRRYFSPLSDIPRPF